MIGSAISDSRLGYRWIFWSIMIFSGATWLLILFTVPETYSPILLVKKARKLRKTTGDDRFYAPHEKASYSIKGILRRTLFRPVEMMITEASLAQFSIRLFMEDLCTIFNTSPAYPTTYCDILFYDCWAIVQPLWGKQQWLQSKNIHAESVW